MLREERIVFDERRDPKNVLMIKNKEDDDDVIEKNKSKKTLLKQNPKIIDIERTLFAQREAWPRNYGDVKFAEAFFATCEPSTLQEAVQAEDSVE